MSISTDFSNISVIQKILYHTSDVTSCDFGNNFYLATGSGDKTVIIWEWKVGVGYAVTSYSPLLRHKYAVTCVRFSTNGHILASASVDGYIFLWDVKTGECLYSFIQSNGNGVRVCAFSFNSSLLVSGGEGGALCVWDLTNYNLVSTLEGHDEESIQGLCFSPDGIIMSSGDVTGSFKIWHVLSLKDNDSCLTTVRDAHDLGINSLEFSPNLISVTHEDGIIERTYIIVTCGNDHIIHVWSVSVISHPKSSNQDLPVINTPIQIMTLSGHTSAVSQVRFNSTGDFILSSSIDKTSRLWQLSSGKSLATLEGHSRYVACCAFSRTESFLVTGSNDKTICIWNIGDKININSTISNSTSLSNVNYNLNHNKINEIRLFKKIISSSGINTCNFSENYIAFAGSDKIITIWNWLNEDLKFVKCLDGHRYAVNQVEFSIDGSLASCSVDGTSLIWNVQSGAIKKSGFHRSPYGVKCNRFSPDGKMLAIGGDDEKVHIYQTKNYDRIMSFSDNSEAVSCLSFTTDSKYIIIGCADGHCRLYDLLAPSYDAILIIENAHDLTVTSCDFSTFVHVMPKIDQIGKYEVATSGYDCLVNVWKINTLNKSSTLIWKLAGHGGTVTCVRYSPNLSEVIASTSTDKTCRIWDSYSGICLNVLNNHEGILTCCAFSPNSTLLATGGMDESLIIWELPKDLIFQSFVASKSDGDKIPVSNWTVGDVNSWFQKINLPPLNVNGKTFLNLPSSTILEKLKIEDENMKQIVLNKMAALKSVTTNLDTPHEYLCPITHQIMRDPVHCSDGYTYERSAIQSWITSGHITSPMTNENLTSTEFEPNSVVRNSIINYLDQLG